ncbi:uncharacterized protein LOC113351202 [Papaver somniferum]|uniref:uncharacterized protein LOC113351202 n=1 Tax=Papaver somniferum TaxID=3469 RepID=UPI000E7020FA|nr:uncharacterized protein LOC113351202 [Papaver somniferum]
MGQKEFNQEKGFLGSNSILRLLLVLEKDTRPQGAYQQIHTLPDWKWKLKTRYKLLSWGLDVDPTCVLRNELLEDDYHLFFKCRFSVTILNKLLRRLGLRRCRHSNWEEAITWCIRQFKGKKDIGTIRKLSFNAFIYQI